MSRGQLQVVRHGAAGPETWSTVWQEFGREDELHERCHVPGDGKSAVDRHWANFAASLPRGAQVIDLGCGAGIVGRKLIGHRDDLRVAGVDWARVPAASQQNLTIHTPVRMEALPFDDRSFDAAVSLFGIEYGNIVETARELQRITKPGARYSFLIHHRESEIVREGSARRKALRGLISGKIKQGFLSGSAAAVDQQRQSLGRQFPGEPMIGLVGDYFRRNIARSRAERQAMWQKLAEELGPEIALLGQLERSAKDDAELAPWLAPLLSIMDLTCVSVLRRGSGAPIAWSVYGSR